MGTAGKMTRQPWHNRDKNISLPRYCFFSRMHWLLSINITVSCTRTVIFDAIGGIFAAKKFTNMYLHLSLHSRPHWGAYNTPAFSWGGWHPSPFATISTPSGISILGSQSTLSDFCDCLDTLSRTKIVISRHLCLIAFHPSQKLAFALD